MESTIDDPTITDEDRCMYELCQTISPAHPALKEDSGILTHTFEGGKYAVYHYKGFPQFLFMVYQEVFCRWLSKREISLITDRYLIYTEISEKTDIWKLISVFH